MDTAYTKEKFPHAPVIIGDKPSCDISNNQYAQALPDRGTYLLTDFFFLVSSCADCPITRQTQPPRS